MTHTKDADATPTHVIVEVWGGGRWSEVHTFAASARNGSVDAMRSDAYSYRDGMREMHDYMIFRAREVIIAPGGRVTTLTLTD